MQLLCFLLLVYTGVREASIYTNLKDTVENFLKNNTFPIKNKDALQAQAVKIKLLANKKQKKQDNENDNPPFKVDINSDMVNNLYKLDPVLNQLKRRNLEPKINVRILRRQDSDESSSKSSSSDLKDWKEEFNELWMQKKFEAVNSTITRGDQVNMVAARPWGVPCGDPNQHDMPWGNCMLTTECDAEYRIYRGDRFCGRTQFVCCALQITNYDLNQGFDVSFADTSFSTDSDEKKDRSVNDKKDKKSKKNRSKKRRHRDRKKRKKKLKKKIKNIVREIRKLLNKAYRNSSHHRQQRTKLLKKYIKELKKQFKKDRKAVKDIHEADIDRIDENLEKKLEQIRMVNRNFLVNSTFRDILINGTITKEGTRMLAEAYPELTDYLPSKWLRRDGGGEVDRGSEGEVVDDYLEYDIEYGAFYY